MLPSHLKIQLEVCYRPTILILQVFVVPVKKQKTNNEYRHPRPRSDVSGLHEYTMAVSKDGGITISEYIDVVSRICTLSVMKSVRLF